MLNVICLNAGNYCGMGKKYVEILHDSVRRNLPAGFPGRFVCFTDDPEEYDVGITKRPLPCKGLQGWWNKLALFERGLFDDGDRVLFLDLDTLVCGRLDRLCEYDGDFAILRDFYRNRGFQSSTMAWKANNPDLDLIWKQWNADWRPLLSGGDQQWIEQNRPKNTDILQDIYHSTFDSYKLSCGRIPDKASVVNFHGHPRPHEVLVGWVKEVWKIGGMCRAELDTVCNTSKEKLYENVRSACSLPSPWLDYCPSHNGHAVLVGGGPSLDSQLDHLRFKYNGDQHLFALNNSANWLHEHSFIPHYHVIVDARPENVGFLKYRHPNTKYLIASQCDPEVFKALDGCDVSIFHSHAPGVENVLEKEIARPVHLIGGGSTVGLSAMVIAHVIGYRKIHLFGFDCCYADDKGHAYKQTINDKDVIVDVATMHSGTKFRSAPWMVQQAQEFFPLVDELIDIDGDTIITVEGKGLLSQLIKESEVAKVGKSRSDVVERVSELIHRIDTEKDGLRGAEIGVFGGDMSKMLLENVRKLTLIMVDAWEPDGKSYKPDKHEDFHKGLNQTQQNTVRRQATQRTEFANGRRVILPFRSVEAAKKVEDGSLDFVFIDADHSYEGCKEDIYAWLPTRATRLQTSVLLN